MSFNLSKPNRKLIVGVVLMNSETEILDVAPIDFLAGIQKDGFLTDLPCPDDVKAQAIDMDIVWINENGTPAKLTSGITLLPTHSFATAPALDVVLIGAHRMGYTPNADELAFVRKAYEGCSAFLTICGGMIVPLLAGLLEGKTATAPRMMLAGMRQQAPGVKWVEQRWVRDGKLWTSGTLLNGLDLMHAFVREYWGGKGSLVEAVSNVGHWPDRSVEYVGDEGYLKQA